MKVLTKAQVLLLHTQLVQRTGGTDGLRDEGMLESALNAPFQSFMGVDACPTLLEKAARLGYGLVKNHPFLDGNKRIGAHAMLVFLALNGVRLTHTQMELANAIVSMAASDISFDDFHQWVVSHQ